MSVIIKSKLVIVSFVFASAVSPVSSVSRISNGLDGLRVIPCKNTIFSLQYYTHLGSLLVNTGGKVAGA
jgi:hypothetical protein